MDRLARIDKDKLSTGLFPDQKLQTSPLWVDGSNVMFDADKVSVFPGSNPLFLKDKSALVTGLLEINKIAANIGVDGICYGFADQLKLWDHTNGIRTVGSGYTADVDQTDAMRATRWSGEQWNEWIVMTNWKDPLQLLKTVGAGFQSMEASTNAQFKYAHIVKKYRQFLVAYNLKLPSGVFQPNAFACCDVNDVETWLPLATNSARKFFIPDLEDGILAVERLNEVHLLYSKNSVYANEFSGYPNVFQTRPLDKGIGVFGKNCVCEVLGQHVGYGPRGLWRYNGTDYTYIDTPPLRKYLQDNLDLTQASKCQIYNDRTIKHVLLWFPAKLSTHKENALGIAWNYIENKFTKIGFIRSVASDTGELDHGVTGDMLGWIYSQSLDDVPPTNQGEASIPVTEGGGPISGGGVVPPGSGGTITLGWGQGGWGGNGWGGLIV